MNIARFLGIVILAIGIALLIFGISSTDEAGQKVVKEVTGHYTDKTMWYIIGGIVLAIAGSALACRHSSK